MRTDVPIRSKLRPTQIAIWNYGRYSLCPRCTRFIQGYICGGFADVDDDFEFFALELELLASLLSLLDVLEAGLEIFWFTVALCSTGDAMGVVRPNFVLVVPAGFCPMPPKGEVLPGPDDVDRSCGDATPVVEVESANLQLAPAAWLGGVDIKLGDSAPGLGFEC